MNQPWDNIQGTSGTSPDQTTLITRVPVPVPLNLCDWVSPEMLCAWVKESLQSLDPTLPEVEHFLRSSEKQSAQHIFQVLLFAYSTERYSHDEIVQACHLDPFLRELCGEKVPFADELEHFSHRNVLLLERALGNLLVRAALLKFGQLPAGFRYSLHDRAKGMVMTAHGINTSSE
jgi:hypothetical protein